MQAVNSLPKPYAEWPGIGVLYCGDCLDILPLLGEASVDAVVTDPPFGIGFKYESHDDTPENYGEWIWKAIESAESKCTPGAPVFVWQAMLNCRQFSAWFPRPWRIFAAAKNFVQMRPIEMQYSFDPVLVWWTNGETWAAGTASRDFHVADTAPVVAKPWNIERGHPCPRPVDQVAHVIEQWVKPGNIALDPFIGSGTTGVACVRTGRRFVGIEKEPKYCEIVKARIDRELAQPRLPFGEPVKETQSELFASADDK